MLYTGARERKTEGERGGDMVRRRKRDMGEGGELEKERNCYEEQGKTGAEENASEIKAAKVEAGNLAEKRIGRQTDTSIKSLDQSREETDETVWEQYDAAIGLIDLKPNMIKERRGTAGSCSHRSPIPLSLSIRRCMNAPLTKIYQKWFMEGIYLN